MQKKSVNIITLGCSKNLVDSEVLLNQFKANGFEIYHETNKETDVVVLNTCGFIDDAKEESIETIFNYVEAKKQGLIKKLFVVGCLSERYKEELRKDIPEVDDYFGVNNFKEIVEGLEIDYKKELVGERIITTPKHFAYLKISEGCDRTCSFCAIPLIRGKHISKPMEAILAEARYLVSKGVKELIVIAQDLSYYGLDIYKEQKLPELVEKLSEIEGLEWIRLHYFYPANFPYEVLDIMREKPNVCNYIDIALQHISDNVLGKMRRNISKQETYDLVKKIREKVPGINLRTTLLVGHPGETEQDFEELKEFVQKVRFERMGVFTYSDEDNTFAKENFTDDIPADTKQARADALMALQQDISLEINTSKIGKTFKVLIDKKEDDKFIGRTEFDSYEVDNEVIIYSDKLEIGKFYNVKITDASEFDLLGHIL